MGAEMTYVPAVIPPQLRGTTLEVAWLAADIYAIRPRSRDAIAEAVAELAARDGLSISDLSLHRAVVTDAACHLAARRIAPHRQPTDDTVWEHWQRGATELWPILADAATIAYTAPLPPGATPGRYIVDR